MPTALPDGRNEGILRPGPGFELFIIFCYLLQHCQIPQISNLSLNALIVLVFLTTITVTFDNLQSNIYWSDKPMNNAPLIWIPRTIFIG